jgi:hypothetical protein
MTLFAVALTLYLVGASALKMISSLLPIPLPVECVLIGLFMGMFPRRTATVFYAVTCGILMIETLMSIPNLIITIQSVLNLGSALKANPIETPMLDSFRLGIILAVLVVIVLAKYRMKAIRVFLEVMLNLIFLIVYTMIPMVFFILFIVGIIGAPTDNIMAATPLLFVYPLILWDIYITVTGPLVARWLFRRIGIYRRIPKIWQG